MEKFPLSCACFTNFTVWTGCLRLRLLLRLLYTCEPVACVCSCACFTRVNRALVAFRFLLAFCSGALTRSSRNDSSPTNESLRDELRASAQEATILDNGCWDKYHGVLSSHFCTYKTLPPLPPSLLSSREHNELGSLFKQKQHWAGRGRKEDFYWHNWVKVLRDEWHVSTFCPRLWLELVGEELLRDELRASGQEAGTMLTEYEITSYCSRLS